MLRPSSHNHVKPWATLLVGCVQTGYKLQCAMISRLLRHRSNFQSWKRLLSWIHLNFVCVCVHLLLLYLRIKPKGTISITMSSNEIPAPCSPSDVANIAAQRLTRIFGRIFGSLSRGLDFPPSFSITSHSGFYAMLTAYCPWCVPCCWKKFTNTSWFFGMTKYIFQTEVFVRESLMHRKSF